MSDWLVLGPKTRFVESPKYTLRVIGIFSFSYFSLNICIAVLHIGIYKCCAVMQPNVMQPVFGLHKSSQYLAFYYLR